MLRLHAAQHQDATARRLPIFAETVSLLLRRRASVLVTHDAPSYQPHGFAVLDELGRSMVVRQSWYGHHHDAIDYRDHWPRLGFEARGVRLRGLTWLYGQVLWGESLTADERSSSRCSDDWHKCLRIALDNDALRNLRLLFLALDA